METVVRDRTAQVPADLREYARSRLEGLARHLDLIARAEVEFGRDSRRSREPLHVVKVSLDLIGAKLPSLRARESSRDLRTAVDLALDSASREVDQLKERIKPHP